MSIEVIATKATFGWNLALPGRDIIRVRTLTQAADATRDRLGVDDEVVVRPDLGGDVMARATAARAASAAAFEATQAAAREIRAIVHELREQGLSVTDVAEILGMSRGRVSQLTARTRWADRARH